MGENNLTDCRVVLTRLTDRQIEHYLAIRDIRIQLFRELNTFIDDVPAQNPINDAIHFVLKIWF